jgi:hypothetical protein
MGVHILKIGLYTVLKKGTPDVAANILPIIAIGTLLHRPRARVDVASIGDAVVIIDLAIVVFSLVLENAGAVWVSAVHVRQVELGEHKKQRPVLPHFSKLK